jgi:dihydrolipoamide dehydrogenase
VVQRADTITIGAGGGAYPGGFRLARAGQRVVMVDPKGVTSGNCLAEGCVPSKAVREMAGLIVDGRRMATRGVGTPGPPDYAQVVAHKDAVQRRRYDQHAHELAQLSDRLSLIKGTAELLDSHTVEISTESETQQWQADSVIVASGADIVVPPIPGAELCLTSRDFYALEPRITHPPDRLVVIGGGYVGLETAAFLTPFGTQVYLLEMEDQLLPGMDPDFVATLAPLLDPRIDVRLDARVERIERRDGGCTVVYGGHAREEHLAADAVLMAVGRHPVVPTGCDEAGVKLDHGQPVVEPSLQTTVSNVYACGDVNGRSPLFHSAVRQSLVAAHNILGGNRPLDYMNFDAVPVTVFTFPEAAYVGLTRSSALERGIALVEAAYPLAEDSYAQIVDQPEGEIRLFFEPGSLRLLGGWMIGVNAADIIGEIGLAVASRLTAFDLARFADQHPMASEGIGKAARTVV